MKRKFISAMLFGALVMAPAATFVGCADYDDDIEQLQGQITTNATTLDQLTKEKMANVEKEIDALKAAEAQLKEELSKAQTDGDAATLAAAQKLVADAQAELQKALDAANGDITEVNGKVSALDVRLKAAEGKLDNIDALLAADGKVTLAINEAQALAEKAYALAEQTAGTAAENKESIKNVADNLKTIKESLEQQINVLSDKVDELSKSLAKQNSDLTAQIGALENQLKEAKEGNSANAEKILANEDKINEIKTQIEGLQNQIDTNKQQVETLQSNIQTQLDGIINKQGGMETSISTLQQANTDLATRMTTAETKLDTQEQLISSIQNTLGTKADASKVDELKNYIDQKLGQLTPGGQEGDQSSTVSGLITAIQSDITHIDGELTKINGRIDAVEGLVNVLFTDLSNLITGVIYQDAKFDMVYGQMTAAGLQASNWTAATSQMTQANDNKVYFPSKSNPKAVTRVMNHWDMQKTGGYLYATINPSTIDFNGSSLNLVDSEDKPHSQYKLGAAETANVKLTRAASKNGLYQFEIKSLFPDHNPTAPVNNDHVVYALQSSYKGHDNVTDEVGNTENKEVTRKVYSKYDIQLNPTVAARVGYNEFEIPEIEAKPHTGSGYTWAGVVEEKYNFAFDAVDANMVVDFTLKTDKPVYAKYIECNAQVGGGASVVNSANTKGLGQAMTAENEYFNKVTVDLSQCLNQTVAFDYYIWNYDGSVEKKIYMIYVTRPMINAETITETVKPTGNADQTHTTKFNETACMKDKNDIWKSNVSNFRIENVQGAALKSVSLVNAQGAAVNTVNAAQFADYTNITNHANVKGLTYVYDPSQLEYGKEYSFDVVFYKHNGSDNFLVNKVTVKYSLSSFGQDCALLISPLDKAFSATNDGVTTLYTDKTSADGTEFYANFNMDWGTTIAWATYATDANGNGYATYKLNASFNHLERVNAEGCYAAFKDVTNYYVGTPNDRSAYATKNGVWFEKNAAGEVVVNAPLIAVTKKDVNGNHTGFVYDMKVGIKHFGLTNLWYAGLQKDFKLVFKSPIYNARNLSVATKTVGYPGEMTINNNDIVGYDPSKSGDVKINVLGGAAQDDRIAKMEVKLVDTHKAGYLEDYKLIDASGAEAVDGLDAVGIYVKAGGLTALQGADDIHFNLIITDVFGCVKTVPFTVHLDPNHLPSAIRRH